MKAQKHTLKNGFRVVMVPMPSVETATLQVFVHAGSRDEEKKTSGLAHFLEHMVFKGTKKYPDAHSISFAADSVGAELNASTDKERTSYYLKVVENHIPLAFDLLSGFVKEPLLDDLEIEREKGVILQEIAMYDDLPQYKVGEIFELLLYGDTPLGWDTAGDKKNIPLMKRQDFARFREKFYDPSRMVLSVAGKFNPDEIYSLAERYFGSMNNELGIKQKEENSSTHDSSFYNPDKIGVIHNSSGKPEISVFEKKTEQAHIILGFRGNPLGHKDRYVEVVLASILGGGMSSRCFMEVREKRGLAYYVRADLGHYTDTGYFSIRAGVTVAKVHEAVRVIVGEFKKISNSKFPISKEELRKAKEYTKGRFALGLEDTEAVSDFFGEQELYLGESRTTEQVLEGIEKVTPEDIARVAREFFVPERLNLAVVGPYNSKTKFKQILRL